MANPELLLSKLLRRHRRSTVGFFPFSNYYSPPPPSSSCSTFFQLTSRVTKKSYCHTFNLFRCGSYSLSIPHSQFPFDFSFPRSFSTIPDSEQQSRDIGAHVDVGGESILPVRAVIWLLDSYHDLTGFPWWFIIVSSTLALRLTLFPILVLQLQKLKRISELLPKLPPPLPPPGRSFKDHISIFRREKKALECPSYLWFIAYVSIQVPCFLTWMTSIRRMSLDHHSGFDCGGTLWFQNLTEYPHGVLGATLPLAIGGLHFINTQVSFYRSSVGKLPGLFGLLAKYYKHYLEFLTLPILFGAFYIPQGSLVYWATNSLLTLTQQLLFMHPEFCKLLGVPHKNVAVAKIDPREADTSFVTKTDPSIKKRSVSVQTLSPKALVALSVKHLVAGHKDRAIPLLQLALDKDPDYVRAMVLIGQVLLQNGLLVEATEHFERAISKIFLPSFLADVENVDLLIVASQWAGASYIRQGKTTEGINHLERVASLTEPEDSKSKVHYFDGLVMLASALYNEGRKAEAVKYLRMAVAYNPDYSVYLEQCENDDNLVGDLVGSRRADY